MIGTELQEFQKWLEYCDFREVETAALGVDAEPRIYALQYTATSIEYTLNPLASHATAVSFRFDDNGNFLRVEGWE